VVATVGVRFGAIIQPKRKRKNGWFFVYKVKERGKADFQWLIMEFLFGLGEGLTTVLEALVFFIINDQEPEMMGLWVLLLCHYRKES
jgi:hypothetical protein